MSDHSGVGAPEPPTTQLPPRQPADPLADSGDSPTRSFAGFAGDQRAPGLA
ncbi:hypothetical protein [Mycobacterium bohemicum]|uniref:hypothetical protein n=1 Tax=Mycobacterium bohemicum TaxID=56425 RepID=UPI000B316DA8|nr:hypothetical protein [Mycobacterium bohemicum]